MIKILTTGSDGYVVSLISKYNTDWVGWIKLTKKELDLSYPNLIKAELAKYDFDIIFHAAAMPLTSDCENFPELTYKVNVQATKEIVDYCKEYNKRLIFCSSEQIFNGFPIGPHSEDDEVKSLTVYGNHKIECENYICNNLSNYLILRFSWLFGMAEKGIKPSYNLLSKVLTSLFYQEKQQYPIHEIRGITYCQFLADYFQKICQLPSGKYNITSKNELNTYEVARLFGTYLGFSDEYIQKYILIDDTKYKNSPRDFHMTNTKLKQYGIDFGTIDDSIKACLQDYGWLKERK